MNFYIDRCPNNERLWKKFNLTLSKQYKLQTGKRITLAALMEIREVELKNWVATQMYDPDGLRYLKFEDPKKLILFILAYS